jgi:predicted permease
MIAALRIIASRARSFFSTRKLDDDFAQELDSHFELLTAENIRRGMSPEEARRIARLKLGSEPALRETHHDQRTVRWLESFAQDFRFALRMLHKNPGFTVVAILTLALGIGATTAMFTILDGVVLKPLQYPDANRIVAIDTRWTDSGKEIPRTTGGDIQDLRDVDAFEAFSFYSGGQVGVQLSRSAEFVGVFVVDPNFFRVFAVAPIAGRTFMGADDANHSAVVSAGFAKDNFGSVSAALGQTVGIESTAYQIVGVMPPMFQFPREAQVWAAIPSLPDNLHRTAFNYRSVAKLAPGLSLANVDSRLAALGNRLAAAFPGSNRNKIFTAQSLQDQLAAPVRSTLFLLMGAVALVLLIACANVANLMLARATARVREIAMRAVLGASRWRIVAQLLLEGAVLALAGAVLGIGIAVWATRALLVIGERFVPAPLISGIHFDWRVLTFTIVVAVFTSILFGVAPAWQACRIDLQRAIKQSASYGLLGGSHSRLRSALVIAQVALSLTLAVGAGLLIRTLVALQRSDLGFRTEGVLVVYADAPARTLPQALDAGRTLDDLFTRLRRLPEVISSAGAMGLPAGEYSSDGSFAIEGKQSFTPNGDVSHLPHAGFRLASPGYFAAMGISLLRGRDFDDADLYDRPFVAIISESLAREDFPNEDPIGHRIMCGLDSPNWMTVVGVVGDVRQSSPAAQPGPELYMPLRQHPFYANEAEVVVRTAGDPNRLIPSVQQTVHDVDPQIAMRFTTMSELVSDSIGTQRFRTVLASIFAGLALLLALSGMYAVMNYITAQRTSEFGLRSALGAQQGNLLLLVLRGAARFATAGVAIGVSLSIASSRLLTSMLFGVKSLDVATYALVIAIVIPVVLLASAIPAWRASRVDPVTALRSE